MCSVLHYPRVRGEIGREWWVDRLQCDLKRGQLSGKPVNLAFVVIGILLRNRYCPVVLNCTLGWEASQSSVGCEDEGGTRALHWPRQPAPVGTSAAQEGQYTSCGICRTVASASLAHTSQSCLSLQSLMCVYDCRTT